MGDFIKASADPGNILGVGLTAAAFALGGPLAGIAMAAGVLSADATIKQAGMQEVELELEKRQEKSAMLDREMQRKARLTAVLGAQRAAAGAAGVAMTGSLANITVKDAEAAAIDRMTDRVNTRIIVDAADRNKRSVRRIGTLRAGASILSGGLKIAEGIEARRSAASGT